MENEIDKAFEWYCILSPFFMGIILGLTIGYNIAKRKFKQPIK